MSEPVGDIALIGLAVMGQNLILNMDDHGFTVVAYNRTVAKLDEFLAGPAAGTRIVGARSLTELVARLKRPRRIMMLIKAGAAVDATIEQLLPLLDAGDIIIDGGNSHYPDSNRRCEQLRQQGIHFIGTGVSGGEEGARHGPSIMPGGDPAAWDQVRPIFQAISARVDEAPCCDWVGEGGAGHYVKMVHNGIEYGDMQLIGEAYQLMRQGLSMSHPEMSTVFAGWNEGVLDSYLIEITRDILAYEEPDGTPLVTQIRDQTGQKGTGKWTVDSATGLGQPVTLIAEAVFARCLSALKQQRLAAADLLPGPQGTFVGDPQAFIEQIRQALYASKIVSYAQGYMLMQAAAAEQGWHLNYGGIALMWRGGCIIRSRFLGKIKAAFDQRPDLPNLLLDDFFRSEMAACQSGWRAVIATAAQLGIPTPAFATALAFYDGYRSAVLPANLLQAQRDYFGAHTYQRLDDPSDAWHHTNWTGHGGMTTSQSYNA